METNATQAPAVGPPSTIAEAMNGKWKVHTEWPPGAGSTRMDPIIPNAIQSSSPPDGPARAEPFMSGSMVGLIGTRSVVHASAVRPAMIETAV